MGERKKARRVLIGHGFVGCCCPNGQRTVDYVRSQWDLGASVLGDLGASVLGDLGASF